MATPKYTPKHFRDVAVILHDLFIQARNNPATLIGALEILRDATDNFADLFAHSNPKFDRALFLAVVHGDKPVNARPSKKADPNVLTADEQFFYDNAGHSYDPASETEEQGRISGAKKLAAAERYAEDQDWTFAWDIDRDGCSCCKVCPKADQRKAKVEQCVLFGATNEAGLAEPLASLYSICNATEEYRRVVEAELALKAIPN